MAIFKRISFGLLLLCYEVSADSSTTLVPDISGKPCRNTEKIQYLSSRHFNGYCYWFTKYVPGSWQEASDSCNRTGSKLASVHSMSELNFLKNLVSTDRGNHIFWIGMKEGIDSVFRWEDGTPVDFVLWDNEYPNNGRSRIGTCAYLNPKTGHFGSKSCSVSHLFICKTKDDPDDDWLFATGSDITYTGVIYVTPLTKTAPLATSTPIISTTTVLPEICPDKWHIFGDKCYGMFGLQEKDKQTWTNADNECVEMGASMISIHSQEEQDFVTMMMSEKTDGTWIGFYEDPSEKDRAFHWADGSPVNYTNWDINQPNNWDGRKEECANMRFGFPHFGRWNDAECEKLQQSYICQIHIDPKKANYFVQDTDKCAEPEGWIKLNSTCYTIFNETENQVTWLQGLSRCNKFGGNLVTVKNLRDTIFLRFHLTGLQDVFWIGMKNEGTHKRYSWITGPAHYSNWDRGQPFEILNKPNCVAINSKGRWIIRDCDESHPFICEVNEGDSGTITAAPQEPGVGMVCPSGSLKWTDYGGNVCYIIELNEQVTWYEATYRCFREGGFLASFHSFEEVNIILKQITDYGNPLYVGLGQKHDGGFGWMDNSVVDFSNWEPGQPSSQSQLCVEMLSRSGTWNDISCELKRGYICSVAKVSPNDSIAALMANKWSSNDQGEGGIGAGIIIAIVLGIMITIAMSVATYCYLYPSMKSVSRLTELESVDL